jgi:hypothetical protein
MKKGFILPLVLLILALMSGIAVVLGRLSQEKTLSLKNQEGSYYAKEITVILVDSSGDSTTVVSGDEIINFSTELKNNITKNSEDKFEIGSYYIKVVITGTDEISSKIKSVTSNGDDLVLNESESTENIRVYSGTVTLSKKDKIQIKIKADKDKDITVNISVEVTKIE